VNWGQLQFGYISNVSSLFQPGQIGVPWEGTLKMYTVYTHWAHWSHLLSVLPMYPACAWWVFWSLSPVCRALFLRDVRFLFCDIRRPSCTRSYDPLPCPLVIPPLSTSLHHLIEFSAPPIEFEPCSPFLRRFPTSVASQTCIRSPFFYSPASCPAPVDVHPL